MSNPAPTLNQINAFNATQGTTIDFNIIGGTEVIRSNKIYIYDLSDNSLICTHLYVSTESIHELPPNTSSSIIYADGKTSADFTNNTQYYAQIQTFTDVGGTQGGSGLSIAKLFWCLPTPTLTLSTIPTTISTTSYNVSATYTPNTSGSATNEIQEFQFNLYSAIGALLQTSGVVLYGEGVDLSYNFSGLEVDSTYYVTLDVTTTQGMNVSAQSNTFTVSIDTPTIGSASVVNNGCDGYISVTSNLSSEYEHEESAGSGEIISFTTDSVDDITELDVDFSPIQDGTPWMSAQDTEPYMFRAVPTQTEDFGHESDTIVGGTVAWNQLAKQFAMNGSTISVDGTTCTTTHNGESRTFFGVGVSDGISYVYKPLANHKYFWSVNITNISVANLRFISFANGFSEAAITIGFSTLGVHKGISKGVGNTSLYFNANMSEASTSTSDTFTFKDMVIIDLTQLFGTTIADYIYSLEQANAGAGVAWFRKLFPNDYYAYDAGSLVSVSGLTSHDMVGFNQWDEEWELGTINTSTGAKQTSSTNIRSKNYIPILPNTTYSGSANNTWLTVHWYDSDKNYIDYGSFKVGTSIPTATSPSNARYMLFRTEGGVYGTTYNHDICINLSDASLNGTYEPYVKHTYTLDDSITLRGIPKLDASNNLYYDGDVYESDGSVTRKYGIVDLGTLNWTYQSQYNRFSTYDISTIIKRPSTNVDTISAVCSAYVQSSSNGTASNNGNYTFGVGTSGVVLIRDENYTTDVDFKIAMNGVYLVYELATPTTEIADPFTNPQIVDPHGTEEYVGSPIPVGHETTYQRICPISGWDSVEVDVVGVNLFPWVYEVSLDANYELTDTGVRVYKLNNQGAYRRVAFKVPIGKLKGQTLTFSADATIISGQARVLCALRNSGGASKGTLFEGSVDTYNQTFTVPNTAEDTDYISFSFYCTGSTASYGDITYSNVQLELGTTKTAYQPYQDTTYTSVFPKYKQQVTQDKIPYITKNIGDTYADTLTENLVGGTIAWNQSVPDTTTTHTVSGSIASMDDAVAGNFESVVCDIDPVQDLHGYDKPWVGGAGVNKLDQSAYTSLDATTYSNGTFTSESLSGLYGAFVRTFNGNTTVESIQEVATQGTRVSINITVDDTWDSMFIGYRMAGQNNVGGKFNKPNVPNGDYTVSFMCDVVPSATVYGKFSNIQFESGNTATPYSPWENLCPITGWTGCEVSQAGVNLFGGTFNQLWYLPLPQGTKIVASSNNDAISDTRVHYYDKDKAEIDYWTLNQTIGDRKGKAFTLIRDACYFKFANSNATDYQIIIADTLDEDTISFRPSATVYPVSWQTEAGTVYGGTVDLVTGVLTVDRAIVDLGTLAWQTYGSGSHARYGSTGIVSAVVPPSADNVKANILCTAFKIDTATNIYNHVADSAIGIGANGNIYCYATQYATAQDFKTGVGGFMLCYELATPTTYQLDPVQVACLLGQNNVWNNIADTTVTYPTNHSYQSLSTTHKYYKRINGVESISVGSDVVADVGTDNIIDLTQMFGTTIADYIYNIEQSSSSGMGVKFFKSLFPNDDYDYNSGELISVNASAHVIKDANGNVLHTYPLDSDLVLRGIPKLDANNKLYYDGDVYEPNGSVTRKYGIVDLGTLSWSYNSNYGGFFHANLPSDMPAKYHDGSYKCGLCAKYIFYGTNTSGSAVADYPDGVIVLRTNDSTTGQSTRVFVKDSTYSDAVAFKSAMNEVYFVYELATSTTEQADPFEANQAIVPNGIEEYIVTEQGDVEMPIGHDSTYYTTAIYGGTIDMAKGVLTINRKIVDLGSLTYRAFSQSETRDNFAIADTSKIPIKPSVNGNSVAPILSSIYVATSYNATWSPWQVSYANNNVSDNLVFITPHGTYSDATAFKTAMSGVQLVYELETPIEISFTPQQIQTLSGQNNIWSNTNGGMHLIYQLPITSLLVKRRDVADVSGKWLTLYSTPITQASDMDFTFIDFLNQYGKTYQYALVPVLAQDQSGVIVQIEGGYTVSDNVDSIFDGVYIADQTNVERVKAGVGYGNIDMNQGVGSITPIGSKYPIVITNSQNQYHNGSIRGTIVPNDFYSNGNLSRIDMVNKRDELEQFLTNKRAKIIKDWNGKMWLVMIMSNVACSFDDNYGMGMVSFSADWLEVGDPTNQQDLYNAGLINVGGV